MREPTDRELFLQNLVATSSTLLFQAVQILDESATGAEREALIIEAQTWFRETRSALIQALEEAGEDAEVTPTLAPPAANNGQNWKPPTLVIGTISPSLAPNTEPATNSEEQSSNHSSGGSFSQEKKLFKSSLLNF